MNQWIIELQKCLKNRSGYTGSVEYISNQTKLCLPSWKVNPMIPAPTMDFLQLGEAHFVYRSNRCHLSELNNTLWGLNRTIQYSTLQYCIQGWLLVLCASLSFIQQSKALFTGAPYTAIQYNYTALLCHTLELYYNVLQNNCTSQYCQLVFGVQKSYKQLGSWIDTFISYMFPWYVQDHQRITILS